MRETPACSGRVDNSELKLLTCARSRTSGFGNLGKFGPQCFAVSNVCTTTSCVLRGRFDYLNP